IEIQAVTIVSDGGPDVDTNATLCPNGRPDGLFRNDAAISITAASLNPTSSIDPFPASVEQCTITYLKPADDPGMPVIEQLTIFPNCTLSGGSSTCSVTLIDITRKEKFWDDILTEFNASNIVPTLPKRYVAAYDCRYLNHFGKSGRFKVELEIFLADFNKC
ncbi:MAG TPA: hypothetical protein VN328_06875, partial [Thermodesulfovibrionales bacterium]|nr:hypothetical protein [Thermodesulfovibrionales bacterium]